MAAARPFRLAIVGIDHPHGSGWRELLHNLAGELEITALVPAFGGSLASLEERYAHLPRFATVDELLTSAAFDGALVALPNCEAPACVTQLARAGKHILVEKPMAACAADARPAAAAVLESGVAFQTGYMWRYDEAADRLRSMLAEGRFGRLIAVEMQYLTSDARRRGPDHYLFDPAASRRGFFNWLACHWIDLLSYLTGQHVASVTARLGVYGATPLPVEDGGVAMFELEGGALASLFGGYWLPRWAGENRWSLYGSERWVHWYPSRAGTNGVLEIHGPQPQWHAMEETFVLPADRTPGYGGIRGLRLVRDWLHAAATGAACRNTPQSMLDTLVLLDCIYESAASGRTVACPRQCDLTADDRPRRGHSE